MKEEIRVKTETASPDKKGRKKKEENSQEVWKWYEHYVFIFLHFAFDKIKSIIFTCYTRGWKIVSFG